MAFDYLKTLFFNVLLEEEKREEIQAIAYQCKNKVFENFFKGNEYFPLRECIDKENQMIFELSPVIKIEKIEKIKTKEEIIKSHQEKLEQTKEFMKKIAEEKAERQKKHLEREKEQRLKILKEIEENHAKENFEKIKIIEEKNKKILEMIKKKELRKNKEIEDKINSQNMIKFLEHKPLFVQMEEHFQQAVIMPELEQQKAKLAKKRLLYQPLNHEEIVDHMKKHEEIRKIYENRRKKKLQNKLIESELNSVASLYHSKFSSSISLQDALSKELLSKNIEEKKNNINKRYQYSKLVKEIFPPVVNDSKKLNFFSLSTKPHKNKNFYATNNNKNSRSIENFSEKEFKSASESIFRPRK